MTTARKVTLGIASVLGVALVLNLVGLIADRATSSEVVPGPDGSSFVTTEGGWAAYHDLLKDDGRVVSQLRQPIGPSTLDPSTTLVIAEPSAFLLDDGQVDAIGRFLDNGGRLVVASTSFFGDLATSLLDPAPTLGDVPAAQMTTLIAVPETNGVTTIETSGLYAWDDTGAALPVVGASGRAVVAVAAIGEGRLILLADPAILSNRYLGDADNAVLGMNVVGGPDRPVVFNEFVHGYDESSALNALPSGWPTALLLGALAILIWLWAIGSRFEPAEPEDRTFPPSRVLYVDALAASLARTPDAANDNH